MVSFSSICEENTFLRNISVTKNLFALYLYACVLLQSFPTFCDPVDCQPPGFSAYRIFQERILEWVVLPSSRGSSQPRDRSVSLTSPALVGGGGGVLYH